MTRLLSILSAFALCFSTHAATGDVQFGTVGSSGALTSTLVTPATPPAVFGTAPDGSLKSFSLGAGLTLTGSTITAAGAGSWADLTGKPTTLAGFGITDGITAATAASTYEPLLQTGGVATSKLNISSDVKSVLDASDFAGIKTALSLTPGTDVQSYSSRLKTLADGFGLVFPTPGIVQWNGSTYQILSAALPALDGGTGITSYAAGDILVANGVFTLSKLSGNTATTRKFLSSLGNGIANTTTAWATPNLATDITGTLPVANGGTGLSTLGTGVAAALGHDVNAASGLLTYDMIGTSGAKVPLLNAANTFGDNVSIATGKRLYLGGGSFYSDVYSQLYSDSNWYFGAGTGQGSAVIFSNGSSLAFGQLYNRLNNGVQMQTITSYTLNVTSLYRPHEPTDIWVFNDSTSGTNYEALSIGWRLNSNRGYIGTRAGADGGTLREWDLTVGADVKASINAAGFAIGASGTAHSVIKSGYVTLSSGTNSVSESSVIDTGSASNSSRILVTRMTDGGTVGASYSITRTNGGGFTITAKAADGSTETGDTSTLSWLLLNP